MSVKKKLLEVQGGYKKGGYSFNILECPVSQNYKFIHLKQFNLGKDIYWHGYMQAKEIKDKLFPLDANPRKPQPTKVVKLMQATLQKTPENFHHLNNGITIIAKNISFDEDNLTAEINFSAVNADIGEGICNGGHTYFAIEQFQADLPETALVRIELIELDSEMSIPDYAASVKNIAEKRNAHNSLDSTTTAHFAGFYNPFIEYLGANSINIRWFEGDPNALKTAEKVDSFIAKLMAISPHWFSHYLNPTGKGNKGNHMNAARNVGSSHKKWEQAVVNDDDDQSMYYMLPLINDILVLSDTIAYSLSVDNFSQVKGRWRSTKIWRYLSPADKTGVVLKNIKAEDGSDLIGFNLAHTFLTMVLGSFRENVWFSYSDEGIINYVGWLVDPIKLWNEHKVDLMIKLDQIAATINAPSFGNAFLQNAAIYGYQLAQFSFGTKLDNYVCKPEVIYEIDSGNKFTKEEDATLATHTFHCKYLDKGLPPLVNVEEGFQNIGEGYYKKYEE